MKYNNRNIVETPRAIKIEILSAEEEWKIFAICIIRNGITEKIMILERMLVSESIVIPQPINSENKRK